MSNRRRIAHGHRERRVGQALTEFAIVIPVLIAVLGGIIQFGMIFWAQNTLTQVVRDTGRWAATQQGCSTGLVNIAGEANLVASNSSLIGYAANQWTAADLTAPNYGTAGDTAVAGFTTPEAVAVAWVKDSDPPTTTYPSGEGCPPLDNQAVYHVDIKIVHTVPVFIPGLQYLPGFANNRVTLSSTAQFRLEPAP